MHSLTESVSLLWLREEGVSVARPTNSWLAFLRTISGSIWSRAIIAFQPSLTGFLNPERSSNAKSMSIGEFLWALRGTVEQSWSSERGLKTFSLKLIGLLSNKLRRKNICPFLAEKIVYLFLNLELGHFFNFPPFPDYAQNDHSRG